MLVHPCLQPRVEGLTMQETPEEKPYHAPGPAADQPAQINFMHESMVEMEGGHPEPMGAAATEPMLAHPEPSQPSMPAQTILQALQVRLGVAYCHHVVPGYL